MYGFHKIHHIRIRLIFLFVSLFSRQYIKCSLFGFDEILRKLQLETCTLATPSGRNYHVGEVVRYVLDLKCSFFGCR